MADVNNSENEVPEQYKKNRIMVVDDEEFCITTMLILLNSLDITNHWIDFCFNGKEALDIL